MSQYETKHTIITHHMVMTYKFEHKISDNYGGSSFEDDLKYFYSNTPNDKKNKLWVF